MEYISEDININEIKIIIADDEIRTCEEIKEYLSMYNQIKILIQTHIQEHIHQFLKEKKMLNGNLIIVVTMEMLQRKVVLFIQNQQKNQNQKQIL